jgi:hypothetical protein
MKKETREVNSFITTLLSESDRSLDVSSEQGAEAFANQNMWMIARIMVHTWVFTISSCFEQMISILNSRFSARVRLHHFRMFMDLPIFLDQHCGLSSINESFFLDSVLTISPDRAAELEAVFPCTEQESSLICLKSSLAIARTFRNLPAPDTLYSDVCLETDPLAGDRASQKHPKTLPYFACCTMQSCYTLLMLLNKVRSCSQSGNLSSCYHLLSNPEPDSEAQDAERLIEEMRHGMESIRLGLKRDVVFEGVGAMSREVEGSLSAAFPGW